MVDNPLHASGLKSLTTLRVFHQKVPQNEGCLSVKLHTGAGHQAKSTRVLSTRVSSLRNMEAENKLTHVAIKHRLIRGDDERPTQYIGPHLETI